MTLEKTMPVDLNNGQVLLHHGDSRDVLRTLQDASIDSIVTDPPYALVSIQKRFGKAGSAPAKHGTDGAFARAARGFMGKDWDVADTAFAETFWAECLRVLKPGGHVVAFGGTRTYHRLVCAIEDAGFEIRDQLGWVYGSGFPKSHNQTGEWQGWGTALKPAWEPICLARKPLIGTVADNVLEHGTGALNIDGCRVGESGATRKIADEDRGDSVGVLGDGLNGGGGERNLPYARWPANIIHDGSDEVLAAFPDAKGQQGDLKGHKRDRASLGILGDMGPAKDHVARIESDTSAARFFYCAKASRKDRDEGLAHLRAVKPEELTGRKEGSAGLVMEDGKANPYAGTTGQVPRANIHPTVKPTSLMQYLCRLITPPGGTILDPFLGSGSTGKAAVLEGFNFVGIEREEEYFPIATARIEWALEEVKRPATVTPATTKRPVVAKQPAANDNIPDLFTAPAQAGAAT